MENNSSKVIEQRLVFKSKWLGIKYVDYEINGRRINNYEKCFRPTSENKGLSVDGVEIVPIIKYQNKPSEIVVIANFRPPVGKFVLEFPSGLLENEDLHENAKRQLEQQTGYIVHKFIELPLPKMYSDPWKSNECGKFVIVTIDGDSPIKPVQKLQNEQNIIVHILKLDNTLCQQIIDLKNKHDYELEGKVWSVAIGMSILGWV